MIQMTDGTMLCQVHLGLRCLILNDYYFQDKNFQEHIAKYDIENMKNELSKSEFPVYDLYNKYPLAHRYFDDWVVVKANEKMNQVTEIIMKAGEEMHIETSEW
ncbi:MAG: hypothetical protein Q4B70_09310 [Lachnospiraceae bacterium]|nr:hypothetical protein [Lachnospiraceae bacterium]